MAKREVEIKVEVDSKQAVKSTDNLAKGFKDVDKTAESSAKSTGDLSSSLDSVGGSAGGAIQGVKGLTKSFIALLANPVGLVLTAVVVVLGTLYKAFTRTEAGGNKLAKGMAVLSGAFNKILEVLEPVANFIVDHVIASFETLGTVVDDTFNLVSKALKDFGFDDAAKSVDNFNKSMGESTKAAMELADADAELVRLKREQGQIDMQSRIDQEKLRQLRDDETKSLAVRKKANQDLGAVLKKNAAEEGAIVDKQLAAALKRQDIEGSTPDILNEIAEAKIAQLEVEERVNGFMSEMLSNENSLRREGAAIAKEAADAKIAALNKLEERELQDLAEEEEEFDFEIEEKADPNQEHYDSVNAKLEFDADAQDIELRRIKEIEDAERESSKAKMEIQASYVDSVGRGLGLLTGMLGESTAAQAAGIVAENAAGIAKMVISNNIANAGALATPQAIATSGASAAPVIAANNLATGINIAASIAATAKGLSALKQGGSAGAKPSLGGGISGGGSAAAPEINEQTLFSTQTLEGSDTENVGSGAGINQIKAIVVESDITTVQESVKGFEESAEIG